MFSDGRYRHPLGEIDEHARLVAILLPISPRECIVLHDQDLIFEPDADEINKASAALSSEFFVAMDIPERELQVLRKLINTAEPFISTADLERLMIEFS